MTRRAPRPWIRCPRNHHVAALIVLVHGPSTEAHAHPFGNRYTAQRLEVDVAPDGVGVRLAADVPDALLRHLVPGDPEPVATLLSRLDHGIVVTVDDRRIDLVALERTSRVDLVQGTDHVLEASWIARVDLRGRHRIRVTNGNLGDQPSYFRDEPRLAPASRLHATNLVFQRNGRRVALHDAWAPAEGLRRVDLDVEVPDDPVTRAFRDLAPTPWDVPTAMLGPNEAWTGGRTDPTTTVLAASVSAWLGLASSLATGGRRAGVLAGVLVAAATLALGGADPGALGVLVAFAALAGATQPGFGVAAPALAAAWSTSSVHGDLAAVPLIGWVVGALVGAAWRRGQGLGLAMLALGAVAAASRG